MSIVQHYITSKGPAISLLTHFYAHQCKRLHLWPWWGRKTPPTTIEPTAVQTASQPLSQSQMLTPSSAISHGQMTEKCWSVSNTSYLNQPADAAVDNPSDMEAIKEQQDADQ